MSDRRRTTGSGEDISSSDMINEYSQDNELRKKIEKLKKQREEKKRIYASKQESSAVGSGILGNISEAGTFKRPEAAKQSGIPNTRVDDTQLDQTRIGFDDDPAYDKILVITNNRNKASSTDQTQTFGEDRTAASHTMNAQEYDDSDVEEEYVEEEIYEEDNDGNLLARIKEKKQRKEEAERKLEQDGDGEEDEDDSGGSAKMNKIITYIVIGTVGVCIVADASLDVKYALSNFLGESDDKKKTTGKGGTDSKGKEQNKDNKQMNTNPGDDEDKEEENEAETSQVGAAQLWKQLDQYESQLKDVEKDLVVAKKDEEAVQSELGSYKKLFNNAVSSKSQAEELYTLLTPASEQNTYRNSDNPEGKAEFDVAIYETASKAYNDIRAKYSINSCNELYTKSQQTDNDYNTKAQAAKQKKSAARSSISSLESRKTDLKFEITDMTTKLNAYN